MLMEMFEHTGPLGLVLQKADLCLTDLPMFVEMTVTQLQKIKEPASRKWFSLSKYDQLKKIADEEITSLPISARLRTGSANFSFNNFQVQTYYPFVDSFIEEINEAFKQLDFWYRLRILDHRNLPTDQEDLSAYGDEDLEQLLDHYGK